MPLWRWTAVVVRPSLRMMRLAFLVLVMDFGLADGSDIPAAFLNEKNACSFGIEFTAYLPRYSKARTLQISFCPEGTLIEPWAQTDTGCSFTMPAKFQQALIRYLYTRKAFQKPAVYYFKCVPDSKEPAPALPNIETRQKEKLPVARVEVELRVKTGEDWNYTVQYIATLPWDRELLPFLDGAINHIKGTSWKESLQWFRDGCACRKALPTPWTSYDAGKNNRLLEHHLSQIPLGGFEVRDTPLEAVLRTFEGRFQDYRKTHPDAARELPKTLFAVRASRALLQQRVEYFQVAPKGSLWSGIVLLTWCLDDFAVVDDHSEQIFFPIENWHIVIRDGAFSEQDMKAFPALAAKLKRGQDEVSRFLIGRMMTETRKMLLEYEGAGSNTAWLRRCVVRELNMTAHGAAFYDPQRFAGVSLSPATQTLLKKNPKGDALVRLNRMLLEDAYPQEIVARLTKKQGAGVMKIGGSQQ